MNYGEKATQVYAATSTGGNRNVMLDSDREKINAIDKAYRDELGKFLSPAEVADFTMHNGQLAGQLRYALMPLLGRGTLSRSRSMTVSDVIRSDSA